jgi:glycerate 2-kinase
MREKATAAGYEVRMYPDRLAGEARDAASLMAQFCRSTHKKSGAVAVLSGGETTVTVRGPGRGGRNQEYVAAMIREIGDCANTVVASIGTDGVDFLEGVGGAIITDSTLEKCRAAGLDPEQYLRDNNTYALHRKLGSLIKTKPTHTNVADISVYLWGKRRLT